ncbi:MAG: HNH endonuclease signature motif containing protein [Parvibaculum sp.]|nr:HNH endonuclease signature motif containing protein [Parvibaculum sp.]
MGKKYWWVNHKQTISQEVEGQYLWSPKINSNGVQNQFYDNMRQASPGDLVLSYASSKIRYVGKVSEFAISAPKPAEFGLAGANWNNDGWLLPVYWVDLAPPVAPKEILEHLGPLLPDKYSPISPKTGNGRQGAYLAQITEAAFNIVIATSAFDSTKLLSGGANSLKFEVVKEILEDVVEKQILADSSLGETEKETVIRARRGQGKFRSNVSKIERTCRLTGISNPLLLIASHIKPWRSCASATERLDGYNGLMLSPDADYLFDKGYVSFENDGTILVSPRVDGSDLTRLGFGHLAASRSGFSEKPMNWNFSNFSQQQSSYLAYHRGQVYVA